MNSPSNKCVIPMPALSLMVMGRSKVFSSVGVFFMISFAVVPAWYTQTNKTVITSESSKIHLSTVPSSNVFFKYVICVTINHLQVPVGGFLAVGQGEGERLSEGGAVCVIGLDDDRFRLLHANEGLFLHQFGDIVVHIQQPHRQSAFRWFLWVFCRGKSEGRNHNINKIYIL